MKDRNQQYRIKRRQRTAPQPRFVTKRQLATLDNTLNKGSNRRACRNATRVLAWLERHTP